MTDMPWVKVFPGDLFGGVVGLEDAQRGVYLTICIMIWDRGAPLPDDPRWMARMCGSTTRTFNRIRQELIDMGKIEIRNGMIGNRRALKTVRDQKRRSDAARSAAWARWHGDQEELPLEKSRKSREKVEKKPRKNEHKVEINSQETAENGHSDHADASRSRAHARPRGQKPDNTGLSGIIIEGDDSRAFDAAALSDHLCRIAGVRNIDPAQIIRNQTVVREWVDIGVTPQLMETEIMRVRDRPDHTQFHSLKYFDPAIRRAHAKTEHPSHVRPDNDFSTIRDPLLRRYLENNGSLGIRH